jgi:hypothetical protein
MAIAVDAVKQSIEPMTAAAGALSMRWGGPEAVAL